MPDDDKPKIISLGPDYRSAPRRYWGSRDKAQARAVDAELRASEHWQLATPEPDRTVIGFGGLHGNEASRRRRRERELRAALDRFRLR